METSAFFRVTNTNQADVHINPVYITSVHDKTSMTGSKTTIVNYYVLPGDKDNKISKVETHEPLEDLLARLEKFRNELSKK